MAATTVVPGTTTPQPARSVVVRRAPLEFKAPHRGMAGGPTAHTHQSGTALTATAVRQFDEARRGVRKVTACTTAMEALAEADPSRSSDPPTSESLN